MYFLGPPYLSRLQRHHRSFVSPIVRHYKNEFTIEFCRLRGNMKQIHDTITNLLKGIRYIIIQNKWHLGRRWKFKFTLAARPLLIIP
jgi:hypothetical protein